MREIKFKAWDKKEKAMVGWNVITQTAFNRGENESTLMYRILTNHADIFHVMQFTGLKDKNGKEIYEGDIVKYKDHPTGVEDGTGSVYWKDGMWRVTWSMIPLGDFGTAWTEVLGNIYENPELLQEVEKGMKENKNA